MEVNIEKINNLPKLNSEIHDMWFSVDQIVFNESKHEFVLFFGATQELFDQYLKVKGVSTFNIKDTEKIGTYDINYLSVDLQTSTISISGCIPITITLKVSEDFVISTSSV